ncbi:MAG: type II toxin-antitoxin system RelE/ParE family toxin [Parvibaculaceae bacterium]|nr:type II toxin-antitoxin system RelE/ParE family toxin [Parvibaculaceae bacterium]|tara:strand:- start:4313 stop:4639 length:327 start_codon:yes stop_codon:yes gene_type:complete
MRVETYLDVKGNSPFTEWYDGLDSQAAAKVSVAITRIELGNLSNLKSLGGGLFEHRMHFGPGYRIYLGKDGAAFVILLGGGTKRRQQKDIEAAKDRWREYKQRKKEGE